MVPTLLDIIVPPLGYPTSMKKRGLLWTPTMEGFDIKTQIPLSSFEGKDAIPKEVFYKICPDGVNKDFYIGSCILDISNTGWIDLNNDGIKEVLISGYNLSGYRGSGGWSSWLFQKKGKHYRLVQELFGWEIYLSESVTNGYFDLIQIFKKETGFQKGPAKRIFKWKEDKYTETIWSPYVKMLLIFLFASGLIGFVIVLRKIKIQKSLLI